MSTQINMRDASRRAIFFIAASGERVLKRYALNGRGLGSICQEKSPRDISSDYYLRTLILLYIKPVDPDFPLSPMF
jgi:hypothetical protein